MKRLNNKGQSVLEYVLIIVVVIGVMVTIGNYFKRGLQGRWKGAIDDVGDQYDPRTSQTNMTHTLNSMTTTEIYTTQADGGFFTNREDTTISSDRKVGTMEVGAY